MTKANPYATCRGCSQTFLKPRKRSVYCSLHCAVMAHVEINENGCWLWRGSIKSNGYGSMSYNGKFYHPHKAMLEMKLGRPLLSGHESRHGCDCRPCVNPDHLLEGTRSDNMRDCVERGRHIGFTEKHCGENHNHAVLKEADVLAIRASKEMGTVLAQRYGVSTTQIGRIRNRESWFHLP